MALFDQTFVKKSVAQSAAPPASPWTELTPVDFGPLGEATQAALALPDAPTAAGVVNGSAATVAESLNANLRSLLRVSNVDSAAAQVKALVRDPIKSAFSARGNPSLNAFITDPTRGTLTDLKLGNGNLSADRVAQSDSAAVAALAKRYGMTTPVNDQELSALTRQAGIVAGGTSATSIFGKSALRNGVTPTPTAAAPNNGEIASYARFLSRSLGVSGTVGNKVTDELAKTFTSGLPMVADALGDVLPGVPADVDHETISLLKTVGKASFGLATDSYCNGALPFGFLQNLFNGLISLSARSGILCAMAGMLSSNYVNHQSAQSILRQAIPDAANRGLSTTVEVITGTVSPGTIAHRDDIGRSLIASGRDSYDVDSITNSFSSLGLDPQALVTEPETYGETIWNASIINASDTATLDALLADATVTQMAARRDLVELPQWSPAALFG